METNARADHPPSATLDLRRILVRGVNWLGDAVMTTPALMRLRERFPDAHITLLAPEKLQDLWRHHPAVNQVETFSAGASVWDIAARLRICARSPDQFRTRLSDLGRDIRLGDAEQVLESARRAGSSFSPVRPRTFDLAVVFPNSPRSALEVWLARIPRRIGYARPWRNWFLTDRIAPRPGAVNMQKPSVAEINRRNANPAGCAARLPLQKTSHQIHEYLHLVAALGANPAPVPPQLFVTLDELDAVRKKFALAVTSNPVLGLVPGAEYGPAKRWPAEKFIAAALEIRKRTNCVWLILGGETEVEIGEQIHLALHASPVAPRNLVGQTSLRELCVLLKFCRVLLANDSGPMHVAAALGTPVVVPFGSTSPELTGPGLPGDPNHHLLRAGAPCSPCFRRECPIDFRCMNGISAERVVEAVVKSLNR